jgi:hypothetical protein
MKLFFSLGVANTRFLRAGMEYRMPDGKHNGRIKEQLEITDTRIDTIIRKLPKEMKRLGKNA